MNTELSGRYELDDLEYLRKKANADDPRATFYRAMIMCPTYETYLALVGHLHVMVESYKSGPISGRDEILYCRRNGRIKDKDNERIHDSKTLSPALSRDLST